jgi:hypothetical protein
LPHIDFTFRVFVRKFLILWTRYFMPPLYMAV